MINSKLIFASSITILFFTFAYVASATIIDFNRFRAWIGDAAYLRDYPNWISFLMPLIEVLISFFLAIPSLRRIGLYIAFFSVISYISYVLIIHNFYAGRVRPYVGIIPKISWYHRILINLLLLGIISIGLVFDKSEECNNYPKTKKSNRYIN